MVYLELVLEINVFPEHVISYKYKHEQDFAWVRFILGLYDLLHLALCLNFWRLQTDLIVAETTLV